MRDDFVIDLSGCNSAGEIISNISIALELPEVINKNIILNLKDFQLNQSQLLSIKSLISSCGSNLSVVKTSSLITKQLCEDLDIKTSEGEFTQTKQEFEPISNSSQMFEIQNDNEPAQIIKEDKNEEQTETFYNSQVENDNQEPINNEIEEEPTNDDLFKEIYNDETALNSFGNFSATLTPDTELSEEEKALNEAKSDEDDEKRVISVYTKVDEENSEDKYEEVDFYAPKSDEPVVADSQNTMYVTQTLRNGQVIDFDGNVVIIGDCHPGSEIRATGDITVWGVLGSIAHAGCRGDVNAKIRALKINAIQLRIADYYSRRPDGDNIPYIVKSATFTPEEARVVDGNIVLYKII